MLDDDTTMVTDSAVTTDTTVGAGDGGAGGSVTDVGAAGDGGTTTVEDTTQTTDVDKTTADQTVADTTIDLGQPAVYPKEIRDLQANKELAANPVVAAALKQLQSAYDRLNAYTTHFPTVADAKKFTEAFPGGVQDALTALQRAQQLDDSDAAFYSRDPGQMRSLAETWQADDGEAFRVLTQAGLETLAAKDPEGYRQLGLTILEESLLSMQQSALLRKDTEGGDAIANVFERIFGRKPGEQQRSDPRDRQYQERERQQKQREEQFLNTVTSNFMSTSNDIASSRVSTTVRSAVDSVLKNVKVSQAQKDRLAEDLYNDLNTKLRADQSLQNQIAGIVGAGKRAGKFGQQDQQKYVNAVYARAQALLRSTAPGFITNWTQTFLGIKSADAAKRTAAGTRSDVGSGGSPNFGTTMLTGAQLLDMSKEELDKVPKQLIPPNAVQLMREEKRKRGVVA